jgi:PKD repeat protein
MKTLNARGWGKGLPGHGVLTLLCLCLAIGLTGCHSTLEAVILSPGAYIIEVAEGETVAFEGSGIGGFPFNSINSDGEVTDSAYWYSWDFGGNMPDEGSGAASSVSVTFEREGVYNVSLTVADSDRTTDTATVTVIVLSAKEALQALIVTPTVSETTIIAGRTLEFEGAGDGGKPFTGGEGVLPYGYFWDIGGLAGIEIGTDDDGEAMSTASDMIDITFNLPGVYTIPFSVRDARGVTAWAAVDVTVVP